MMDEESEQAGISIQNVESSICLLRGQIYEAMENWVLATENYREALRRDVYCFEAFELLMKHQMLTAEEEKELMRSLHVPLNQQCPEEEADTLKNLYLLVLKKYDRPSESSMPKCLASLATNLDVVTNQAERHYYNCDFRTCYKITTDVLNKDPYHAACLPLHIAVLVEVKKSNELFYLAHKLVDLYPNKPIAWFAVGCYYYLVGKNEPARRFFSKATTLDRLYGPAWLAFGHSFAAEGEHDQAMAAYFKASQVMKGCHLPLLFVGLEHGQTKNFRLAEKFFSQALAIAPNDPFVLHEMGVAAFHNATNAANAAISGNSEADVNERKKELIRSWETAAKYFTDALNIVQTMGPHALTEKWESLLNNMGHVSRKLKKYEQALDFHRQALVLCPQNSSTFSAMGYVYSLMGNFSMAIDYFHKALGVGRDDTFSVTMLAHAIEQYICEMSPCEGADTPIPELMDAPLLTKEHESSVPGTPRDTPVTELIEAPLLTMEMENSLNTTKDDTSSSIDIEVEMEDND
ncbi:cell division cycle protein 16 homolog isoform X2 [Amphiura filiformis]